MPTNAATDCVKGSFDSVQNVNCFSAIMYFVDQTDQSMDASFIIIVGTSAFAFLGGWVYLFMSVPLLESGGDGNLDENQGDVQTGDAMSPYHSRTATLRCNKCGSSIPGDAVNIKFCPVCGAPKSNFVSLNLSTGKWDKIPLLNDSFALNSSSARPRSLDSTHRRSKSGR
jgi:hypothetical protein